MFSAPPPPPYRCDCWSDRRCWFGVYCVFDAAEVSGGEVAVVGIGAVGGEDDDVSGAGDSG